MRQPAILVILVSFLFGLLSSCSHNKPLNTTQTTQKTSQPNILWIYLEDQNPVLSSYGVDINPTPNIDKLAENGVLFKKAFTPAPVCSSARSAIILGAMPTTFGVHNHHSSRTIEDGIFLPKEILTIPELMKDAGYTTFNHGKDDYNFIYNRKDLYDDDIGINFWYTFSGTGDWKNIVKNSQANGKPFFGQIQLMGGKWGLTTTYPSIKDKITPIDPSIVPVPPYYPDVPEIRDDIARHYDAARYTDVEVGEIMASLKSLGALENTYVFFFSDHGYKGIRHKQFVYDGGIHIPLIVAHYGKNGEITAKQVRKDLVSGIDIGTTSLALAGVDIPDYMEGKNFFDKQFQRDHIIATRDRCDFTIDRIRGVRTQQFKYIKNDFPERSYMQPAYRDGRPEFKVIQKLYKEGKLTAEQAKYPAPNKPKEELFDLANDPHEIRNLAEDPVYRKQLIKMRQKLAHWQTETGDRGSEPQHPESLRFMLDRWGKRCVNPEYDEIRGTYRDGQPRKKIKF